MKSPIRYPGGKGMLAKRLLEHFPDNYVDYTYVEPFGGGGSVLFAKQPSKLYEVYNDVDSAIYALFRCINDSDLFHKLYWKLNLTPYSHQVFNDSRQNLEDISIYNLDDADDLLELAYWTYVNIRQGYVASFPARGWSTSINPDSKGGHLRSWLSAIDLLPDIFNRFKKVQVQHLDWRDCVAKYDNSRAFMYMDPPYLGVDLYTYAFTVSDHEDLIDWLIDDAVGLVALSNYANELYDELLDHGWRRIDIRWKSVMKSDYQVARDYNRDRIESLYLNY